MKCKNVLKICFMNKLLKTMVIMLCVFCIQSITFALSEDNIVNYYSFDSDSYEESGNVFGSSIDFVSK